MQTVIGAFDDNTTAQRAVERLVQSGIDRQDVHVEQQSGGSSMQGSSSSGSTSSGGSQQKGGVGGFFASLFGTDEPVTTNDPHRYDEAVRRGSSIVVVDARDEQQAEQAATMLHELGAYDVDERSREWESSGGGTSMAGGSARPAAGRNDDSLLARNGPMDRLPDGQRDGVLDVVQEELKVGKRSLDRGGVRVIQRVTEKPVREMVRLREEQAVVERTPVDREASAADLSNFREGTLEVRETVEEPVVSKTARVVEEVRVGKQVREREENVEGTVRRKDVDVQRMEGSRSTPERAVAGDRGSEPPLAGRDDGAAGTVRPARKDKPL